MRKIVASVGIALLLSVVVAPGSSAAVAAGAACKKAGQVSTAGGMKYTCVKKSGKLVWSKGVAVKASAKPSATTTASASATPSVTATAKASATPSASAEQSHSAGAYTMAKVKAADSAAKCWSVISGDVYDLTKWISAHPGGEGAIKSLCGTDGTQEFLAMHRNQSKPEARLSGFLLGPLAK